MQSNTGICSFDKARSQTYKAPDSFVLFCKKRMHESEMNGQDITTSELLEEWKFVSDEQKAEFHNQSQCIQFTLDIDNGVNNNLKATNLSTSSMIIPNEPPIRPSMYLQSNDIYQPPQTLPYSAAAEAAALESLMFDEKCKYQPHPEKIKRPPNAYLLFNKDMRRKLKDSNQGMSSGEISKNISQRWKQLSKTERDEYFRQEALLKQQHNNQHTHFIYFRRSKAELKQAGLFKSRKPPVNKRRKNNYYKKSSGVIDGSLPDPRGRKKKEPALPKHPMSAYLHFAKKVRPIIKSGCPDAKLVDISKQIGSKWRSMTELEQRPYVELANQDKARYAREMKDKNWLGHTAATNEELDSATIATVAQMVYPK